MEEEEKIVRMTFRYSRKLDEKIKEYMSKHIEISNKTEAVRRLIVNGLRLGD